MLCTFLFFFNDTATTEIYTLSLHDALPIWIAVTSMPFCRKVRTSGLTSSPVTRKRSEEHTSELQSRQYLVCRLLLEKKKIQHNQAEYEPRHVRTVLANTLRSLVRCDSTYHL